MKYNLLNQQILATRQLKSKLSIRSKSILLPLSICIVVACGGQGTIDTSSAKLASQSNVLVATTSQKTENSSLLASLAREYPKGQLPAERTAQAAKTLSQNPSVFKNSALITAQSSVSSQNIQSQAFTATDFKPVYRIQNTTLPGSYFFTIYEAEKTAALAANPNWNLEGPAFYTLPAASTDLSPVYRFRNKVNGSYLYTAYESEKTDIQTNYGAIYELEGVAWRAQQTEAPGFTALYRFRNLTNGTYLNTAYAAEKDAIVRDYPLVFKLEGIAYYVHQDGPPPKNLLTDTGIPANQCYGAGSNVLISCTSAAAIALNDKQDGMIGRDVTASNLTDGILGFSYSEVPNPTGGNFARSDCIKDNITELMWEGKPAAGARANTNTFTNLNNNASTDASGYVAAVNAAGLCGHTDWRLPTRLEMLSLVNFNNASDAYLDIDWFPNTINNIFWTSSISYGFTTAKWRVTLYGSAGSFDINSSFGVRLVREQAPQPSPTYTYSANGSEVIDTSTGLVWRRCLEGQTWSGSACSGTAATYTHENALIQAKNQTGWRLPNVKELSSVMRPELGFPAVDKTAFPGVPFVNGEFWTSTPNASFTDAVGKVYFGGELWMATRSNSYYVRLVR